jgi:HSP20 family protein
MIHDNSDFEQALKSSSEGQLAVDVIETNTEIIIQSAIAGISPDDIEINITPEIVTIRGERKKNYTHHSATVHFEEVFWGTFSRSIILPANIQPADAKASFKDGILTLTLPKVHGEMRLKIAKY